MESSTSSWTEISDHSVRELSSQVARLAINVNTLTTLIAELNARIQTMESKLHAATENANAVHMNSVHSAHSEKLTIPLFSIGPRAQHVRESNRALRTKEIIPFDKELSELSNM